MHGTDQSEAVIGILTVMTVAAFALWRILDWIKRSPTHPDPWDSETGQAVQEDDAVPVCHRCLTPVPPGHWFCETCGCAVGPYNNYMPYLQIFSEGEVLRNGTQAKLRFNALIVAGYVLCSLNFLILAPVYWFFLFRNLRRSKLENSGATSPPVGN
ncbi:MAG: hypothetical protein EXS35_05690 [Pedosphaera sp.]|nr:hypothetical protein [Pedosphaera sp.]